MNNYIIILKKLMLYQEKSAKLKKLNLKEKKNIFE